MFSLLSLSRSLMISLAVISTISIASAAFFPFSGTSGLAHILGSFFNTSVGNGGTVSFDRAGSTAALDMNNLTGQFYLETVGWATFSPGAQIIAPASGRANDMWTVIGTANSVNAGQIDLSGVKYDPVNKKLVGYGINNGVGKVPFGIAGTALIGSITSTGVSTAFEGRVKVLGNIGSNTVFDTYYTLGSRFNASLFNDTLNSIRKKVALLTRNIPISLYNATFTTAIPLTNKLFYINTGSTVNTLTYRPSDFPTATIDSLIIIGGDLIIDTDISTLYARPKGIIVLKNDAGVGGNIIIKGTVKKIESSIFTEGTLYSGDDKSTLYNDNTVKITSLPEAQLYIHGTLISRNTIGGAIQGASGTCVYGETSCSYVQAIRYDFNYFRSYNKLVSSNLAFRDNSLDAYSLIIELDPRIATTPPPGF